MTIGKQQEALLFTLTFDQLDRLYGGIELTALEEELFRRVNEYQGVEDILEEFDLSVDYLRADLQDMVDTVDELEIELSNRSDKISELMDELDTLESQNKELLVETQEKEVEINNLKDEIEQLHTNTNSESEF